LHRTKGTGTTAYRAATHDTMGITLASPVFGRELRLPYDLLFGAPPDKGRLTTDIAADLVGHLRDIHNNAHQHLKLASDWMKTRYTKLANSAGYQEGDRVWLFRPTHKKGKSPKLQSPWEGPYEILSQINHVVYRIQKNHRSTMMIVHLDRLAPYHGAVWNERTWEGSGGSGGLKKTTGTPRKNGEILLGCSGWTTLREQCGVPPKKLE
jgi:hypothetical protein